MAPLHQAGKAADYSSCNSLCQERSRKVLNAVCCVCLSLCVSVCLFALSLGNQVVDKRRRPPTPPVSGVRPKALPQQATCFSLSEHGCPFTSGFACEVITGQITHIYSTMSYFARLIHLPLLSRIRFYLSRLLFPHSLSSFPPVLLLSFLLSLILYL